MRLRPSRIYASVAFTRIQLFDAYMVIIGVKQYNGEIKLHCTNVLSFWHWLEHAEEQSKHQIKVSTLHSERY